MIYLDNAATSFPKPSCVTEKAKESLTFPLGNPGRSGHFSGRKSAEEVFLARESIARLLGLNKSENVVFTGGATCALNLAITGVVEEIRKRVPTPLVVTSVFEHNSVLRPLFRLEKRGEIRLKILSPQGANSLLLSDLVSPAPHILILTLKSNVTGRVFPIKTISNLLRPFGTVIIGDGAQAVGGEGATFSETGVHILCAPGHKGLFGMMGGGFLAISEDCPVLPAPILSGGSGTESFREEMPDFLPERLEAGTLPVPAIISMGQGAQHLLSIGTNRITKKEKEMKKYLIRNISRLSDFVLYEPYFETGPLLFNHKSLPSEEVAARLDEMGVCVRGGFHCAPFAHRFLGTEQTGGVRVSTSFYTKKEDLDGFLERLERI